MPLSPAEQAELDQLNKELGPSTPKSGLTPAEAQELAQLNAELGPKEFPLTGPNSFGEKALTKAGITPESMKGMELGLLPGAAGLLGKMGVMGRLGVNAAQGAAAAETMGRETGSAGLPDPSRLAKGAALGGLLGLGGEAVAGGVNGLRALIRTFKPGSKEVNAAKMAELLKGKQVTVDPTALEGVPEARDMMVRAKELGYQPPAPRSPIRAMGSGIGPKSPYEMSPPAEGSGLGSAVPQGPSTTPLAGYEPMPEPPFSLGYRPPSGQGSLTSPAPPSGYEPPAQGTPEFATSSKGPELPPIPEGAGTGGLGPTYSTAKPIQASEANALRQQLDAAVMARRAQYPAMSRQSAYPEAYGAAAHLRNQVQGTSPEVQREFGNLSSALGAGKRIKALSENPLGALFSPVAKLGMAVGVEPIKGAGREMLMQKPTTPWLQNVLERGLFKEKKPPEE